MTSTPSMNTSDSNNATIKQAINPHNVHKKNRRNHSQNKDTTSPEQEETAIKLSTIQLFGSEIKLLSRGLSFFLNPKCINWAEVHVDINEFARRLRLKKYFHQTNEPSPTASRTNELPRFGCKGTWTSPKERDAALDNYINAVQRYISL